MSPYLWQADDWPHFTWDAHVLLRPLSEVRKRQSHFLRTIANLGYDDTLQACARIVEEDAMQTSAIEGELLDREGVRSSVAQHLGLSVAGLRSANRSVDGLVQVLLDATHNHATLLTEKRVCAWHAALFPDGRSGLHSIVTGAWRTAPMQVISGPYGRQRVHFEAPLPERLPAEMTAFFVWWAQSCKTIDGIIRAGLAHLYFVTIHPFDDGNGRLARTITDMALAQDEGKKERYYSLSMQIMKERNAYYEMLAKAQLSNGDCTEWLLWFIACLERALIESHTILKIVLQKAAFWKYHAETPVNMRQQKVLNRLLDAGQTGFEGGLSTRKYAGMTKVSRATAWREIEDLLQKKMLCPLPGKGRSTAYAIDWSGGAVRGQMGSVFPPSRNTLPIAKTLF